MNKVVFFFLVLAGVSASADAGFYLDSKPVVSYADGSALFKTLKSANENDEEIDVCYVGSYDDAISVTKKQASGAIVFSLIDVYGEDEFPALDLEFSNDKGESAYGIIHSCN